MNSPVSQISSSSDRGPVGRYVSIWNRRKVSSVAPTVVDFMSFGQHLGIWRDADRSAPQPRHTSVSVRFATNEKVTAELYRSTTPRAIPLFHFPPDNFAVYSGHSLTSHTVTQFVTQETLFISCSFIFYIICNRARRCF